MGSRVTNPSNKSIKGETIGELAGGFFALCLIVYIGSWFPSGGPLIKNESLSELWIVPMIFIWLALTLDQWTDNGVEVRPWLLITCDYASSGTVLGLYWGAIQIINQWYKNPDKGTCEPLLTATLISVSGILLAQRIFKKVRLKKRKNAKR